MKDELRGMQDQLAQGLSGQAKHFVPYPLSAPGDVHSCLCLN